MLGSMGLVDTSDSMKANSQILPTEKGRAVYETLVKDGVYEMLKKRQEPDVSHEELAKRVGLTK
jgi:hypothetical protein